MLVTQWIWEKEHYIHAMEYVKVQSVQEYLTGVAACRSFKGFRTSLQTMVQTADNYSAAGVPLSMLRGNGGSKVASDMFLLTRQSLRGHGLPESLIASNAAGRAAKAQSTIVATALKLRVMDFSDDEIPILLRGNHASFPCQQKLLVAVGCLQSETQVKNKTIVRLLRGGNNSKFQRKGVTRFGGDSHEAVGDGHRGRCFSSKTREIRCGPFW